jgi:hypothetical protein
LILWTYLVFAVLATVVQSSIFYAPRFYEVWVPVIGWGGLGLYCFTLQFAVMAMITSGLSFRIDRFLWIATVYGVADFCMGVVLLTDNSENPYIRYSPWRPLITIGTPLLWIVLLRSAPMRRWNERGIQPMQASEQKS